MTMVSLMYLLVPYFLVNGSFSEKTYSAERRCENSGTTSPIHLLSESNANPTIEKVLLGETKSKGDEPIVLHLSNETSSGKDPWPNNETHKTVHLNCANLIAKLLSSSDESGSYVKFFVLTRGHPKKVQTYTGNQFGLEWTDFRMSRMTVVITHGFLSKESEQWVQDLENAFLDWYDVNVITVDWSQEADTINYFNSALQTPIVGREIARLLNQIVDATTNEYGANYDNWGPLYLVGHSLGAHIMGFAANELAKRQNKWLVKRITGLDPAQPCFEDVSLSHKLDKSDAPLVDVIHTNTGFYKHLGLGVPDPIGHMDFYPNGGKRQPGCESSITWLRTILFAEKKFEEAICSHGRAYQYLTESIVSATARNGTFWAQRWDLSFRRAMEILHSEEPCNPSNCVEMGINAVRYYPRSGSFFTLTSQKQPFTRPTTKDRTLVIQEMESDHAAELED